MAFDKRSSDKDFADDIELHTVLSSTSDAQVRDQQSQQSENMNRQECAPLSTTRFLLLCLGVASGLFLSIIDTSIVATSLYSISVEFKSMDNVNWVALAYTLTFLGFAVLFARISDVVGRKAAFLAAYAIFIMSSLACGWARDLTQLVVFRAFQGIGGSGLYGLAMVILPELASESQMKMVSGIIGLVIAIAGVVGPVLGGVLTHYASWRWVFWINGPAGAISVSTFLLTWPSERYIDQHRRKWRELDYLGSALLIAGAVLIVFPFQITGTTADAWSRPVFIVPLVMGTLCLVAMFSWQVFLERRWGRRIAGAFPLDLVRNRVYTACLLHIALTGFPFLMCIYVFPIHFQVVNGKSALMAGVFLLPMLGASAVGSTVAGAVNGKQNRICETMLVACMLMILGCALETTAPSDVHVPPRMLGFLVLIGFGFGLSVSSSTLLGNLESPFQEHATAQGVLAQMRILGGSIGIAASTAIQGVKTRSDLAGVLSPSQIISGFALTLTAEEQAAVREAYTNALKEDMTVCCAIVALAFFATLGVYRRNRVPVMVQMRARQVEGQQSARGSPAPILEEGIIVPLK